jgi:hypothetical protein
VEIFFPISRWGQPNIDLHQVFKIAFCMDFIHEQQEVEDILFILSAGSSVYFLAVTVALCTI